MKQNDDIYINEMDCNGIVVVKNHVNQSLIPELTQEVNHLTSIVKSKINTMQRPLRNYSDIAERQKGRLDFRCGFTANIFKLVEVSIINLIKKFSPQIDFRHYWGAIPALAGAGPTDLHRDVYPILNNTEGMNLCDFDIQLPPYYFTVLIPLVEITQQNGPTEFIKGSHTKLVVNENNPEIFAPLLQPGDILIFDGRTMHRGAANRTEQERQIAYITFIAEWYYDQTFVINDYLFPELSTKGK